MAVAAQMVKYRFFFGPWLWIEQTGRSSGAQYIIHTQYYKQSAPKEPEENK